jgi:hypothetical protein
MNLWTTLGIAPASGLAAAALGLGLAAAFASWRLRRRSPAKVFDLRL